MTALFRDPIILVEFISALLTFYYVLRVTMLTNRGSSSMVIDQNRELPTPITVRQIFNVGALLPIRKRSLRGQKFHAMLTRVFIA